MPLAPDPTDVPQEGAAAAKRKRKPREPKRPQDAPAETNVYTVLDVAGLLQISERQVNLEIAAKRLGHINVGTCVRVTHRQYMDYLRRKEIEAGWLAAA